MRPLYAGSHSTDSEAGAVAKSALLKAIEVKPQVQGMPCSAPSGLRSALAARSRATSLKLGIFATSSGAISPSA